MATIQDQIATARAAGYNDDEIANKLSTMPDYGDKIKTATKSGYSSSDIVSHLSGAATQSTPSTKPPDSEGVAQGKRIIAASDQANRESGTLLTGAGEAAVNMATGIGSSIAGGWRGLATLATGGSLDDAAKASQETQHDYTYQPRTGVGKLGAELLAVPLNIVKSAGTAIGGDIGQAINGEQGRLAGEAIGNALPDVGATIAGGRAAFKGRSPVASTEGRQAAARTYAERAEPIVDLDTPAYVRSGEKAQIRSVEPVPGAVPTIPPAKSAPMDVAPIDAYASGAVDSPYGRLSEPITPTISQHPVQSALDSYAARDAAPAIDRPAALNQFDDMLRESGRSISDAAAQKSPLEALIAGEMAPSPIAATVASLRDGGDIAATMKSFGIDDGAGPQAIPPMPNSQGRTMTGPGNPAQAKPSQPAMAITVEPAQSIATQATRERNLQVLRNVGVENIRKSAIDGDAAKAAQDFQTSKYTSEPAGMAALDQFTAERDALAAHTQKLIDNTRAHSGLDEQSMQVKGQDIAAPYDAARVYFEEAKKNLYDTANKRAAESGKPVVTTTVDALLADPDFKATLMAKDQQGLLNTIQSQYDRFTALDPKGLTVANAELYRKWLNNVWSPASSGTLGKVKGALDKDVFKSAGDDVYAAGRQMHQLEKRTLDDPNGIAKLMDADPYTPINRATPYGKIPDAIINLSLDQFKHIIDTYRTLPEALQPMAQKAIDTIKAHYGDKFLSAGMETGAGNARQLWNSGGVNKIAKNNSSKLPMVFSTPEEMAHINNLVDAGNILRVNSGYPGASAQAANAMKHGLMSRVAGKVGAVAGGGVGAVLGPVGAGAGAFLGDAVGSKISNHIGERKALAQFKDGIIADFLEREATAKRAGK